jgi:hypothetical protein
MVIFFRTANDLMVDTQSCFITKGPANAAGLPVVIGDGTAQQQSLGRSITSGNMNPMYWIGRSTLLIKSLVGVTTFWVPFDNVDYADAALNAIGDAIDNGDDVIYINADGTSSVPS